MAPAGEDIDSVMESLNFPEDDLDDKDLEETLSERLWGLTEIFPKEVRNVSDAAVKVTCGGLRGLYSFARVSTWYLFSSAIILFAPVLFEVERVQVEEMQRSQQKQVLLGPNAAMAGMSQGR